LTLRPAVAWLGCATCLALLAAAAVFADAAHEIDADMLDSVVVADGSGKERVAHLLAWPGDPVPLALMLIAACGIALARRRPLDALAAIVVVGGACATTLVMKDVFADPRPLVVISGHELNPASFPSGHVTAVASMAIAFVLVVPSRWRAATAALGAVATVGVGGAVVALTWHYPSDVAGGILVAGAWGFAVLAVSAAMARSRSPAGR
jgi:membrane-associated phospholipid phosphatase